MEAQLRPTIRYHSSKDSALDTTSPFDNDDGSRGTVAERARSPLSDSTSTQNRKQPNFAVSSTETNNKAQANKTPSPLSTRFVNSNTRWDSYSTMSSDRGPGAPPKFPSAFLSAHDPISPVENGPVLPSKIKKASFAERAAKMGRDTLALETRGAKKTIRTSPASSYTAVKGLPHDNDSDMSLIKTIRSRSPSPVSALDEDDMQALNSTHGSLANQNRTTYSHRNSEGRVSPTTQLDSLGIDMPTSTTSSTNPAPMKTISRKSVPSRNQSPATAVAAPLAAPPPAAAPPATAPPAPAKDASPHFVPYRRPSPAGVAPQPDDSITPRDTNISSHQNYTATRPAQQAAAREDTNTSRFSWTTVNTATTYQQDSPPTSPLPPLPAFASKQRTINPARSSSLQARLPTPPMSSNDDGRGGNKALPVSPAVRGATTPVEALMLQEEDLELRRRNINRAIFELTKINTLSPLEIDWKTRKANEKKLDEHRQALRAVRHEEHEVGVALTRARRRMDDGTDTSMWVRRVTG